MSLTISGLALPTLAFAIFPLSDVKASLEVGLSICTGLDAKVSSPSRRPLAPP
jgi:hypothetical protein